MLDRRLADLLRLILRLKCTTLEQAASVEGDVLASDVERSLARLVLHVAGRPTQRAFYLDEAWELWTDEEKDALSGWLGGLFREVAAAEVPVGRTAHEIQDGCDGECG